MQIKLSPSALSLLLRGFFFVLAVGSFYGVWDNREYFLRTPFYVIAFIDLFFGILFLYFGVFYSSLRKTHKKLLVYGLLGMWLYTVVAGALSAFIHAKALGFSEAAATAGYEVIPFIFSEALYAVILPSIAFGILVYFLKKKGD